ncbi:MAG: OmpH family outer membrane protein [Candidatus Eisenbacteria bacterium]|uniref:OmpH family outer membrane protein n=1 Tax=Eiseniibacteriota bacterium TaxID=2212470 RepID=A0A7Y2E6K4_UNCEI|nr:OmpH family outer membrane protein [Candidatus Eisenbacteria bacterium]
MSRKSFPLSFLLFAFLLVFDAAQAPICRADLLIGFIDSERIFAGFQGTKDAQVEFNADLEQWSQDLENRKQELEKLAEDYENQSLILSEPRRREREEEIQRKRSDLDLFVREIWGPSGKIAQRNEELTRPIVERMREVLTQIGKDEGFALIFDAADGNVVYADRALDLTDRVLAALNEQQN